MARTHTWEILGGGGAVDSDEGGVSGQKRRV